MSADPDTIPGLVDPTAENDPEAPALILEDGAVSYGALARRSRALAAGLAGLGIVRGDVVLLWHVNGAEWLETFFACARIGAVVFSANTRYRSAEIADVLGRAHPRAVIYAARYRSIDFAALLDDALAQASAEPPLRIATDGWASGEALDYRGLADTRPVAGDAAAADDGAVLFTTSGTTSKPKFVLHTHRSIAVHARAVASHFGMNAPGATMLQALPYSGVFGFCQAMAALAAGRPSVVQPVFDAPGAAELIRRHSVSHFNATDEMLAAMVDATPDPSAYASLRLVGAASFNRGPAALAAMARDYGLPVVGLYGMSEIQALFARRSVEDPDETRFTAGGRPVSSAYSVRVRALDDGRSVSDADGGELECAGPGVFDRYFGDAAATEAVLTPDGFVRTGDFGWLEPGGGFAFDGRMGDTLRLGGYLVSPSEIAEFVCALPGVADCQVVGVQADGRARAAAFVIAETPGSIVPDRIEAACRDGLAPYKVPVFVHELDVFPAVESANGVKVQRAELRIRAQELVDSYC